jgi:predicted DsbA family dithiol-disulfide isomerase
VERSSSPDRTRTAFAATSRTGAPVVVDVYADVVCPFTHVGLRRFVQRRTELGRDDLVLRIRAWPLEIVNGSPLTAELVAAEVDELRREVAPRMFEGFRPACFPSTSLPALALADAAYGHGLDVGEQVSLELRSMLFERGMDVSRPDVLQPLAAEYGVQVDLGDPTAVLEDYAQGRRRGVVGSPHYFTAGGGFFCPALDVGHDEAGHLRVRLDPAGFDRFVDTCLTSP